jgi:GNAT superfamily N-acetyltransferase
MARTTSAAARTVPRPETRVLGLDDLDDATVMLARGFAEEPGSRVLFPDPETRRTVLETGARNRIRAAVGHGTAHGAFVGDELAGIALWDPPGVPTITLAGALRTASDKLSNAPRFARGLPHAASVLLGAGPEGLALVRARVRAVRRASRGLTWHLAFLATSPEHRGRGLARQLLDRQLRRCDEDGAAAWLETTDPVNPPIYERFGFDTVVHVERAAWLPGLWVMRREARSS